MYFPEIKAAGPVVASEWETIGPTHMQYNPDEYMQRMYSWPSEHRGQKFVNPMPVGAVDIGVGEHPADQKLGLVLLLVGIGILAYYLGKSSSPSVRTNPYCTPRRRRVRPTLRRMRRRLANIQPRDELGRFVPTGR